MSESMRLPAVVIGAGPAGLTAAWELNRMGRKALVLEQDSIVGGISRIESWRNDGSGGLGGPSFSIQLVGSAILSLKDGVRVF